jgi:hypothetical protein
LVQEREQQSWYNKSNTTLNTSGEKLITNSLKYHLMFSTTRPTTEPSFRPSYTLPTQLLKRKLKIKDYARSQIVQIFHSIMASHISPRGDIERLYGVLAIADV